MTLRQGGEVAGGAGISVRAGRKELRPRWAGAQGRALAGSLAVFPPRRS